MSGASLVLIVAGAIGAVAAWRTLRGSVSVVEVEGRSMVPGLQPGDWLIAESVTYRRRTPRAGEIVIAADPRDPHRELVKRAFPAGGGRLNLLGDAEARSTDSRSFGDVVAETVRWRAAFRYWPLGRAGWIS